MEVRFSPFNVWYEINSWWEGRFLERTVRGAFSKTMREQGPRVKVLFNHGTDFHIGDKILGVPRDLREEADAAVGDVPLLDTSYNQDLLPGLRAGGYGSSFMFRVIKDEWNKEPEPSDHNPEGLPERTITEIRLYEFGPVTWPANPEATAGIRSSAPVLSMTDDFYARLRERDPERVARLEERVRSFRTPTADEPPSGTPQAAGAAPDADEPAARHSGGLTHAQRRVRLYPYLTKEGASS
ncbi:HK97 family phage prohead protease [Microbispora sp. NPDC088329]|uniref:HK97 family phage prohead protease n=1 Tax=Microbispora sp. NPDC088329 TaxID=3154869 RepID=UPI00342D6255